MTINSANTPQNQAANPAHKLPESAQTFDLIFRSPDDIDFNEIALALSQICCYAGQVEKFYSVAEHCVRVASIMPQYPQYKVYGVLHDARQAYIGDILTPMARSLGNGVPFSNEIDNLKADIDKAIYEAAGIHPIKGHPAEELIVWANRVLRATERRDLLGERQELRGDYLESTWPLRDAIKPWEPEYARERWLQQLCNELIGHFNTAKAEWPQRLIDLFNSRRHLPKQKFRPVPWGGINGEHERKYYERLHAKARGN